MQMVKWVSAPALCLLQWTCQGVAFRRKRGKRVAGEVSPQEWGMGVDQKLHCLVVKGIIPHIMKAKYSPIQDQS